MFDCIRQQVDQPRNELLLQRLKNSFTTITKLPRRTRYAYIQNGIMLELLLLLLPPVGWYHPTTTADQSAQIVKVIPTPMLQNGPHCCRTIPRGDTSTHAMNETTQYHTLCMPQQPRLATMVLVS